MNVKEVTEKWEKLLDINNADYYFRSLNYYFTESDTTENEIEVDFSNINDIIKKMGDK